MTDNANTMPVHEREARGIRGRFGCDVWEHFVTNMTVEQRTTFLIRQGVPEARLVRTLKELYAVLREEGITRPAPVLPIPSPW